MGLTVSVYRDNGMNCTNGASATYDRLLVTNVDGPFNPTDDRPTYIISTNGFGNPILIPENQPKGMIGPMFGGNYAACCDSRFNAKVREIAGHDFYGALPIHDRFETQENYDSLCR